MARFDLAPYRPIALDDLVRVGRDHDGGYVVSRRSVDAARALVGLGISDDWSFEEAFARSNPGVRVVGVDGSVSPGVFRRRALAHLTGAAGWLLRARRQRLRDEWGAAQREFGIARDMARFFDGRRRHFVPRYFAPTDAPTAVSWPTLARRYDLLAPGGGTDVFLKMDIEGAEYETLDGVLPYADRLAGVVVEFHDLDREWDRFVALMDALLGPLAVAHLHGNNCDAVIPGTATPKVVEVSFVNRRLLTAPAVPSTATYPLPGLDMRCSTEQPEHVLAI
jgi:hypothetical protein